MSMAVKPARTTPAACRKLAFGSKSAARREARRAVGAYQRSGPMLAYLCACGAWHIGHDPGSARPCHGCGLRIVLLPSTDGPWNWAFDAGTEQRHHCPRR